MFDWARGSSLQALIEAEAYGANWDRLNNLWLKNWNTAWFDAVVEVEPSARVIDVGSSRPIFMQYLHNKTGCETHALDAAPGENPTAHFGFQANASAEFPGVSIHHGLAGQDGLPGEHFDLVVSVSAIEHMYDVPNVMATQAPLAHLDALRDMCRMLKPGGLLAMNWDVYLSGLLHHFGWDYLADFWLLEQCGMRLVEPARKVRDANYILQHPDSIFFGAEGCHRFNAEALPHGISINAIWRKPGGAALAQVKVPAALRGAYLPREETYAIVPQLENESAPDIDGRFRKYIAAAREALGAQV